LPHPDNEANNEGEIIKNCPGCPYVIWENPENAAIFVSSMCGVYIGSYSMAAELYDLGQKLIGIQGGTEGGYRTPSIFHTSKFSQVKG
jgi:hypothetical protein